MKRRTDIDDFIIANPHLSDTEIGRSLGVPRGNIYRSRKRLEEEGRVATKGKKPTKQVVTPSPVEEKVVFEQEIERLKLDLQETRKKLKVAYRENDVAERVMHLVENSVKVLPAVRLKKTKSRKRGKVVRETAVSLLSCLHVGEVVNKEEMGGLGEFNFNIFLQRCAVWEDTVVEFLSETMQGYEFEELVVLGLGDFVSGIIHQELLETNEFPIVEQVFLAAQVMATALQNIQRRLNIPIRFEGVVGNHGRVKKEYYFKNTYVNWDYVCYRTMELMLQNCPDITFVLPKSFFSLTDIKGYNFLFFHGNHIKGWMGIPWYGINRAAANFQNVLAGHGRAYDYLVMAHFHQTGMIDSVKGEHVMNGTWKGGDEYALGSLNVVANPRQWLFGVHERHGITWRLPVQLDTPVPYDGRYCDER